MRALLGALFIGLYNLYIEYITPCVPQEC